MTIFEAAKAVSIRAEQISTTGTAFVESSHDSVHIAINEIISKKSPLIVIREVIRKNNIVYYEKIPIREMLLPAAFKL